MIKSLVVAGLGMSALALAACSSNDSHPEPGGAGGAGASSVGGAGGGSTSTGDPTMPPDTTVCAKGTYEFPFRSGTCIDDPCDPDPCNGTGTCSNVTGVAVCTACTLFVDATAGLDSNDGKSPASAWQTLAKVGGGTLAGGDNVCLKRGEVFSGSIAPAQSGMPGNPIHFGNYGDSAAAKPVVSGLTMLSGWTQGSAGIWKAPCAACGATVNMVTIDGAVTPMGRTPNRSAPNGGYATYESVIGPANANAEGYYSTPYSGPLGIVDTQLTGTPDWTGAEVVIRKTAYVMDRATVSSHAGSTIQYPNPMKPAGSVGRPGWGYFFQNSLLTLDEAGEWYYDPQTHELDVYFGPNGPGAAVVGASSVENLVSIGAKSDIAFDGIEFRGANGVGVLLNQSKNVTLTSVEVRASGKEGIVMSGTDGITVTHSVVDASNDDGILVSHAPKNTLIEDDIVSKSGIIPGAGARLGDTDEGNYSGIAFGGGIVEQNAIVRGNVVDQSGYNGIHFFASGIDVENNVITHFTQILDDGGGIYTWRGPEVYVNRKVVGNIVLDGPGAPDGKASPADALSSCIYLDNATSNIEVTGNTMARCARSALLENYARDVTVSGNTAFDSRIVAEIWSLSNAAIVNNTSTDNIFFARNEKQMSMSVSAVTGQIQSFGTFDHNFYARPSQNDLSVESTLDGSNHRFHTVASWKLAFGLDPNSGKAPVVLKPYGTPTLVSGNLSPMGDFEGGLGGIVVWSATNNTTNKIDTTGKLDGSSSLELTFAAPTKNSTLLYTGAPGVGAVSSAKSYLIRVSTVGSSENGILSATLRQTKSPYANLSPAQLRSFGTSRVDHEFLIQAPTDDPSATFVVGIDERSGTTWVDGIQVFEVTAPALNPDDSLRFEVNARTSPKTVTLDGTWIDVKNVSYAGSITLAPFTSAILMKPPVP